MLRRTVGGGDRRPTTGRSEDLRAESPLAPLPVQEPLEFWTGGMVPAALRAVRPLRRRVAPVVLHTRRGTVGQGGDVIDAAAATAGREMSREHFGVSLAYAPRPARRPVVGRALGAPARASTRPRWCRRDSTALRRFLEAAGPRGGVLQVRRPAPGSREESWRAELEALAADRGRSPDVKPQPDRTVFGFVAPRRRRTAGSRCPMVTGRRYRVDQHRARHRRRPPSARARGRSPSSAGRPTRSRWSPGCPAATSPRAPHPGRARWACSTPPDPGWRGGCVTWACRCPTGRTSPRTTPAGAWWPSKDALRVCYRQRAYFSVGAPSPRGIPD